MISQQMPTHNALEAQIAEKYRAQGCEVVSVSQKTDLPFDLGGYYPALVVRKANGEGYIIEVKGSVAQISVDRYREIAETVAQHPGWSFLLVTGDDVCQAEQQEQNILLTWEQMLQRLEQAERLVAAGETEAAFLSLWRILEAALRRQAVAACIPVECLPTVSLIKHLYSQGELSLQQFDQATALQSFRNRFVHGYQIPRLDVSARQLQAFVHELLDVWSTMPTVQPSAGLTQ